MYAPKFQQSLDRLHPGLHSKNGKLATTFATNNLLTYVSFKNMFQTSTTQTQVDTMAKIQYTFVNVHKKASYQ